MHYACMSTKTITLSMPAYERLRQARRRETESFSHVVLRARWPEETVTGDELLRMVRERTPDYGGDELKQVENAKRAGRPPEDKWRTD
jgi:predicted CopG family antitoxin